MKSRKNNQRKAISITISTTLLAYVDKAAKAATVPALITLRPF